MAPSVNDPGPVGATATLTELVPASVSRRASLTGYTGLIIPVVGVGVASGFIGYFRAVLAFSILLAILCVFSLASIRSAPFSGCLFRSFYLALSASGTADPPYSSLS